jgi:hypothetical protein
LAGEPGRLHHQVLQQLCGDLAASAPDDTENDIEGTMKVCKDLYSSSSLVMFPTFRRTEYLDQFQVT